MLTSAGLHLSSGMMTASEVEPELRRTGLWTALLATGWWLAFGIASVIQYRQMVVAQGLPVSWEIAVAPMASSLLWIPPTWLAFLAAREAPIGSTPWSRWFPAHFAATLAVILFRAVAVVALNDVVGWYRELPAFGSVFVTSIQNNLFMYMMVTAAAHAVYYARNSRLRERQLAHARLHTLAAQLQPHFLFNALNTVASLVHENPATAEKVIIRLSALLRETVGVTGQELVPLHEELNLLEGYLEIEQARFEDRLLVKWDISVEASDALIPHFILQPIVENSIVHGLRPVPGPVTIVVSAKRSGDSLVVTVRDSGAGFEPGTRPEGFGITSTRERLEAVYQSKQEFAIASRPGEGTTATLTVPFLREPPSSSRDNP